MLLRSNNFKRMQRARAAEAVFYCDFNDHIRIMSDEEFARFLRSHSKSRRRAVRLLPNATLAHRSRLLRSSQPQRNSDKLAVNSFRDPSRVLLIDI
jgi:hypothetical protein